VAFLATVHGPVCEDVRHDPFECAAIAVPTGEPHGNVLQLHTELTDGFFSGGLNRHCLLLGHDRPLSPRVTRPWWSYGSTFHVKPSP
jgi:hypothetical protein